MFKSIVLGRVVILGSIVGMISCNGPVEKMVESPVDRIVKEESAAEVLLVNDKNEFTVVDTRSGKRIQTCKERKGTKNECEAPVGFFAAKCKASIPNETVVNGKVQKTPSYGQENQSLPRNIQQLACIFKFESSYCRTYVIYPSGYEYEICH